MYQYAVGPFTTPSQPGDYTYALDGVIDNGNCHANFHLNMPYRVSSPDLCTNNTPPSTPEVVVNTSSLLV